jgi:hypothetical protein
MKKLIFVYLCSWTLIVYNFACTNQHFEANQAHHKTIQKQSLERNLYLRSESNASSVRDFIIASLPAFISFTFISNPLQRQDDNYEASLVKTPAGDLFLSCRNLRI